MTIFTVPAQAEATSFSTNLAVRQGSLQGAKNATRTGSFDCSTFDLKSSPLISGIKFIFVFYSFSLALKQFSCQTDGIVLTYLLQATWEFVLRVLYPRESLNVRIFVL